MLQGMERHQGVSTCTTNVVNRIDYAALHRFTFKIRFRALNLEQRRAMLVMEALGGVQDRMLPDWSRRLEVLDQLCLGDFAAVQRHAGILGGSFGPLDFLEQLEAEHRIKPEVREQRGMGFMQ